MKNCEQYLILMSRQIDGDLVPDEEALLAAHLSECEPCRAKLHAFSVLSGEAAELQESPPEGFAEDVMRRISLDKKNGGFFGRRRFGLFTAVAAAAILLAVIGRNLGFLSAKTDADMKLFSGNAQDETQNSEIQPEEDTGRGAARAEEGADPEGGKAAAPDEPEQPAQPEQAVQPEQTESITGPEIAQGDGFTTASLGEQPPPDIPYEDTFSMIVVVTGTVEGFEDCETHTYEDRTDIFVLTDDLKSFTSETELTVAVFEGEGYDSAAQYGLLIVYPY